MTVLELIFIVSATEVKLIVIIIVMKGKEFFTIRMVMTAGGYC